jgi:excisionase family DNA binding protein
MHERRATRVYRVKAVAEMFDVSVATIYRAIETGQLNALKLGLGRGTIRVPQSALEAFARSCDRGAGQELSEAETTPDAPDARSTGIAGGQS